MAISKEIEEKITKLENKAEEIENKAYKLITKGLTQQYPIYIILLRNNLNINIGNNLNFINSLIFV